MKSASHADDFTGLRRFVFGLSSLLAVMFGIVIPLTHERPLPMWPWVVAFFLGMCVCLFPKRFNHAYRCWMKLASILERVNTSLLMGAVFLLAITPAAMLMRLFRHDPLQRWITPQLSSYRIQSTVSDRNQMEKPY